MTNDFEDKLDAIRVGMYEQMKDLPQDEALALLNGNAKKLADEFGFTIVKDADEPIRPQAKT
jgi:hypothetical protein